MNSNNRKKIVVTGAGGFLGSNLVKALKGKDKYLVYALSSHSKDLQNGNVFSNVQYYHKDVVFCDEGVGFLKDAIVVNCAFPRNSTGIEMADGLRYIQCLFNRAKKCQVKAVINISSQSVYSQKREESATEETPVCLESSYAVGKYATELMLESVFHGTKIAFTNLRMGSLIGPGFDQRIVNRFVKQALEGRTLHVMRSKQRFGFLDIEDAVRGIILLLKQSPDKYRRIYTLGNNKAYTIEEIIECIQHEFVERNMMFPSINIEDGEQKSNTSVDYARLGEDTDFKPEISLE